MGRLSTHILDTVKGLPAPGVRIELHRLGADGSWLPVTETTTNADGRTDEPLLASESFALGTYQLSFYIGAYFKAGEKPFLDIVPLRFTMSEDKHYHVPLLATPWSYSTYRGS